MNVDETLAFAAGEGVEVDPDALTEQWFSAEEGLHAISALLEFYKSKAEGNSSLLLTDLESAEDVLRKASAANSRFHFSFDLP